MGNIRNQAPLSPDDTGRYWNPGDTLSAIAATCKPIAHRVILSHNHNHKPLVEAIALRLAAICGQDQVFYDSWSIRPGDGIIDQMNKGLEAFELVFFFVSANSLASGMAKLAWQNAIHSAPKGKTRMCLFVSMAVRCFLYSSKRCSSTCTPPDLKQRLLRSSSSLKVVLRLPRSMRAFRIWPSLDQLSRMGQSKQRFGPRT